MKTVFAPYRPLLLSLFLITTLTGCPGTSPQFFDSAGQTLAYRIEGEGPPLILLHGFQGTGPIHWQVPGTSRLLAKNFQVITLDNRGHGHSDKPTRPEDYGLHMVEDIRRLMEHLNIETAHFAGYSMGGWISLKFAATYPEQVLSLAIGGSGYNQFDAKQVGQIANDIIVPYLHPGYDPAAFAACSDAFSEFQLTDEEIQILPTPLLAIAGSEDFAREQAERLIAARPDGDLFIIPGTNHNSTLFTPAFQLRLEAFFDDAAGFET